MPTGVYQTTKKDGTLYFRAGLTYRRKHISLGSSSSKEIAYDMYEEAKRILDDAAITRDNYTAFIQTLSFEKAITLLNVRDHGIYIKTPIYLESGFFSYYLKPDFSLKFDNDDLFYYSSHKIMQRGGHLFVSDYGMQYNIAQRYGIKNFAVVGRDYEFVNGDPTDYRYANIRILNKYHGITQTVKNNRTWYVAKLHLSGDVIVGKYTTEVKAAVAYNKAVDYARDCGIKKEYIENYVTELSVREYAELYSRLRLSDSFCDYIDRYV